VLRRSSSLNGKRLRGDNGMPMILRLHLVPRRSVTLPRPAAERYPTSSRGGALPFGPGAVPPKAGSSRWPAAGIPLGPSQAFRRLCNKLKPEALRGGKVPGIFVTQLTRTVATDKRRFSPPVLDSILLPTAYSPECASFPVLQSN